MVEDAQQQPEAAFGVVTDLVFNGQLLEMRTSARVPLWIRKCGTYNQFNYTRVRDKPEFDY